MESARRVFEEGDIFFFYRARVDVDVVRGWEDVQRFVMVLAPRGRDTLRMFVIGRKRLPEIIEGIDHPEERNWATNVLVTDNVADICRELAPVAYETKTRGHREQSAMNPVGEGVYELSTRGKRAELAYVLELPKHIGAAQRAFGIERAASYVVSVRNPTLSHAARANDAPMFPPHLREKFGARRWIEADDSAFFDVLHAELLLIGCHKGDAVSDEVVPALRDDDESQTLRRLELHRTDEGLRPLFIGEFPASESANADEPAVWLPPPSRPPPRATTVSRRPRAPSSAHGYHCTICDVHFQRRSEFERHVAASHPPRAPSAADVTRALKGIHFPRTRDELVAYVADDREGASRVSPDVMRLIERLPDRIYRNAADVARGLGEEMRSEPIDTPKHDDEDVRR